MVKGKSSASSGTRKKHARRAAGPLDDQLPSAQEKKGKSKDKSKRKEPREKAYIPPVKPAPVQPDPLDTLGLAHRLPPDLLIALRSLTKKAAVTKIRALEELQTTWVGKCLAEGDDSLLVYTLVDMLPVWLHHVSALSVHSSRRIRLLTAGLHSSFLQISAIREQILIFLRESASSDQLETILGTWCMIAHDIDRSVATLATKSWNDTISFSGVSLPALDDQHLPRLLSFLQRAALDPIGVYMYLNPVPLSAPVPLKRPAGRATPSASTRNDESDQSARLKADEHEESEQDRKARLRVGAFGAIRWVLDSTKSDSTDSFNELFGNLALWSALYHGEACSFVEVESFGHNQPAVRKSAWTLVQSLLRNRRSVVDRFLQVLSTGILRSAWVELDTTVHSVMWQPLLTFLKEFPGAWELENIHREADDSDSDADDGTSSPQSHVSVPAYREFLQFLELGCGGSPLAGYPTIVIILSTLPSATLAAIPDPLTTFFVSFWAAIDGRAMSSLQRAATSAAFLSALLECTIFLIRRLRSETGNHIVLLGNGQDDTHLDAGTGARILTRSQFERVWRELSEGKLKVAEGTAAKLLAQTLETLDRVDTDLFRAAWEPLTTGMKLSISSSPQLVFAVLNVLDDNLHDGTEPKFAAHVLITEIMQLSVDHCETVLDGDDDAAVVTNMLPLASMLRTFGTKLFAESALAMRIDALFENHAYRLLATFPTLLLGYLSHQQSEDRCLNFWHILLSGVSQHPADVQNVLAPLLNAAHESILPKFLKPGDKELDALVSELLAESLEGFPSSGLLSFIAQIVKVSQYFLSLDGLIGLLERTQEKFINSMGHILRDASPSTPNLDASLSFILILLKSHAELAASRNIADRLIRDVFILAYLLPQYWPEEERSVGVARQLWSWWLANAPTDKQSLTNDFIKSSLKTLLLDTGVLMRPENIWAMVEQGTLGIQIDLLKDILPPRTEIDDMLFGLSPDPADATLAVLDPLIPPASAFIHKRSSQEYDKRGFSSYARAVSVLLYVCARDRHTAKENLWVLRHIIALEIYAEDFIQVPSTQGGAFGADALSELNNIIASAKQVATYLLTSSADENWRKRAVAEFVGTRSQGALTGLPLFLVELIKYTQGVDTTREVRILRKVLRRVFDNVDKDEADQWISLARKLEKAAPQTCMAIVSAVSEFAPEPPRLDRYRNELASGLLGVPPSKANTDGLLLLRKLVASAPDPDSDVIFLPQLRAVNLMKACQAWITSDEDIGEEVESEMTLIFFHLAPILQNVPGTHWALIFDILDSNLENCSFTDDSTLVVFARTLKLILRIGDLVLTNKTLRAEWQERQSPVLRAVLDLAAVQLDDTKISAPRSACRELVLSIVQDLPPSLVTEDTLSKMCHLLTDSSTDVQKMAYKLLQTAAKKRTQHLVIEAGVDTDATFKAHLPAELLDILQRGINDTDGLQQNEQYSFGYLLSWMVTFDLFLDASLTVRLNYIDQLRMFDIIALHFLPAIFSMLNLDEGIVRAFKLDVWAVDEYYVELYDPGTSFSLQVFAAHLYYRALLTIPSLIHNWVLDCKDRQLSSSIAAYTAQHFSPVLIRTELAHIKSPEATAELVDESFSVKVSGATNEVTAAYLVDEHQLEIRLKIPVDWPLHKIEIRDLKRVGVDENRWRAWVLAVQQTLWAHNGRIVDGLGLFRRNATLYFEGQVECAICYSILSVTDGTLPRKPCKTCKNRFHAGCLYKWFNTSHSSSCPLCRSDMV